MADLRHRREATDVDELMQHGDELRNLIHSDSGCDFVMRADNGHVTFLSHGKAGFGSVYRKRVGNVESSLSELLTMIATSNAPTSWVAAVLRQTADHLKTRPSVGDGLTEAEAAYLVESGAFTPEQFARTEARLAAGQLAIQESSTSQGAVVRSLPTDQVAKLLGIDESRVRHRQRKNNLYSFLLGRSRLYPQWQFVGGTGVVLPHLSTIVPAFPEEWQPASVEGFMTNPQDGLRGDADEKLTPIQWLIGGGEASTIVAILEGIAQR